MLSRRCKAGQASLLLSISSLTLWLQVQDLEGQAVTAALALSAGRQQMSALHAERSVLQEDAQRLAAELAGCEAQLLAQATAAGNQR